ncbi:MAG TPA: winged helix DNA-binding domain-containing protein [Gaiellaceae bacterium]|nr:winged helix DNA-binding domain-containing protein [Gaiellaceae bacterium]
MYHLVGLQAQVPRDPYVALRARLEGFAPAQLERALLEREVVRIGVMRGTIHLVTAADCLPLRALVQPVYDALVWRHRDLSPLLHGVDLAPVVAFGHERLRERPLPLPELREALARRFPDRDAAALAYACVMLVPSVQVPPRGLWTRSARVTLAAADAWLGRKAASEPEVGELVLRYLGAFGPATVSDATTWSRLTGLREVFERLRPRLVTFRDERGRELFDLPDAPRPDLQTPAPVRFLPEYDNVLLSHADRSRFARADAGCRLTPPPGGLGWGAVLVDGLGSAIWRREDGDLVLRHLPLPKRRLASVVAEGRRLLRFLEADGDVRPTELD